MAVYSSHTSNTRGKISIWENLDSLSQNVFIIRVNLAQILEINYNSYKFPSWGRNDQPEFEQWMFRLICPMFYDPTVVERFCCCNWLARSATLKTNRAHMPNRVKISVVFFKHWILKLFTIYIWYIIYIYHIIILPRYITILPRLYIYHI